MRRWLKEGFTLAELSIVMGILTLLLSLSYISVNRTIAGSKLNAAYEKLRADLKSQQMNAVSGATSGGVTVSSWGIEFYPDHYVLTPQNLEVELAGQLSLSTDLATQAINFQGKSGEVIGIDGSSDSIILEEGDVNRIIKVNKYGKIVVN